MKTWKTVTLVLTLGVGPVLGIFGAAGCQKNPLEKTPAACKFPTSCFVSDAAPPQVDGTKPIPVQDCIAAAARAILTIEQQVGMLGQTSATDPTVKAVAQQMSDDFGAAIVNLNNVSPGLGINEAFDCPDKELAAGLVQPALTTTANAAWGAAFDAQFVSPGGGGALEQALDSL